MDILHDVAADALGTDKTNLYHQLGVFWLCLGVGGFLFYMSIAALSTTFFFLVKGRTFFPPTLDRRELWTQVKHEIHIAGTSLPMMAAMMTPAAVFSYRGYSKIYYDVEDYGWAYIPISVVGFFLFTDMMVYFAHRGLHHPLIYRWIHKAHHTYRYTTPFSSHAFHPVDGFMQGVPYYIFVYLFPMHNLVFFVLFAAVNFWTVSIHDQVDFGGTLLNSTGHHTIHHVDFNYNYGQYSTFWDRLGGSYKPAPQTHTLGGKQLPGFTPPAFQKKSKDAKPRDSSMPTAR